MSKLKTEGVAEFINDAIKTFENCGLLPSELLEMTEKSIAIQNETGNEKRKLQQQNQACLKYIKLLEEELRTYESYMWARDHWWEPDPEKVKQAQELRSKIEALTKEK